MAKDNLCTHLTTSTELLQHHLPSRVGHVECRVLLGVGRSDDRHQMVPVRRVDLDKQHKIVLSKKTQGLDPRRLILVPTLLPDSQIMRDLLLDPRQAVLS